MFFQLMSLKITDLLIRSADSCSLPVDYDSLGLGWSLGISIINIHRSLGCWRKETLSTRPQSRLPVGRRILSNFLKVSFSTLHIM